MRWFTTASFAAVLAIGLIMPAAAQAPQDAMPGQANMHRHRGNEMQSMRHDEDGRPNLAMLAMMAQHTKGIAAFLKAELAITAAQEPQWAAFAAVLGDAMVARHAAAVRMDATPQTATAPARMDARVAALTAALDTAKALAGTGKALYAVLTPEQRVLADGFWAHHLD